MGRCLLAGLRSEEGLPRAAVTLIGKAQGRRAETGVMGPARSAKAASGTSDLLEACDDINGERHNARRGRGIAGHEPAANWIDQESGD